MEAGACGWALNKQLRLGVKQTTRNVSEDGIGNPKRERGTQRSRGHVQPSDSPNEEIELTIIAKLASLVALAATVVPCVLYFTGAIGHDVVKWIALVGTALWFLATPLWMGRELPVDAGEVEI